MDKDRNRIISRCYAFLVHVDKEHPDVEKWDNYKILEELFKLRKWHIDQGNYGYAGMIKSVISKIGYCGIDRDAISANVISQIHDDFNFLRYEKRSKEEREAHARLKQTQKSEAVYSNR